MRRGVAATIVVALAGILLLGSAVSAVADDGDGTDPTPAVTDSAGTPTPDVTPTPTTAVAMTGAVSGVQWTRRSTTSVELQWTRPADATGTVTYAVVATLTPGADRSLETTATHVTFTNVPPGTKIVPEVTATDREAALGPDTWTAWTQPAVAPSTPTGVTLAAAATGAALVATWNAPKDDGGADLQSYTVRLYDGTGLLATQQIVDPGTHTATFDGLTPSASYSAGVVASNETAASAEARSASATVPTVSQSGGTVAHPAATGSVADPAVQAVGASPSAVVAGSTGHLSPVVPFVLSIAAVLLAAAAGIIFLLQRRSLQE